MQAVQLVQGRDARGGCNEADPVVRGAQAMMNETSPSNGYGKGGNHDTPEEGTDPEDKRD